MGFAVQPVFLKQNFGSVCSQPYFKLDQISKHLRGTHELTIPVFGKAFSFGSNQFVDFSGVQKPDKTKILVFAQFTEAVEYQL